MNATSSLQVGQAKQMPHVISDTGGRNYVWGDIIQLRITTRSNIAAIAWQHGNIYINFNGVEKTALFEKKFLNPHEKSWPILPTLLLAVGPNLGSTPAF